MTLNDQADGTRYNVDPLDLMTTSSGETSQVR